MNKMWWIRTDFVGVDLEYGNWTGHGHETEEEARKWWNAPQIRAWYARKETLTDPDGNIVETRTIDILGI